MRLLYFWDGYDGVGYTMTGKYSILYNLEKRVLNISRCEDYIDGFWGDNISDMLAVVGENGSGKTTLARKLKDIFGLLELGEKDFLVFEDEVNTRIKIYMVPQMEDICVELHGLQYDIKQKKDLKELKKCRMVYYTSVMSLDDYKYKKHGIEDLSFGGRVREAYHNKRENYRIPQDKNHLLNYYNTEMEKMLEFVYQEKDNKNIPFPIPKQVVVSVNDYRENLNLVLQAVWRKRNESQIREGFLKFYRNTSVSIQWSEVVLHNLILNLFKDLCISQTIGEKKEKNISDFFEKLENAQKNCNNLCDIVEKFFELLNMSAIYQSYVEKYDKFVQWLKREKEFLDSAVVALREICVLLSEDNSKRISELLQLYNMTNFACDYLTFEFGLSAGEFQFLNHFMNLKNALSIPKSTAIYENKSTDILLYLDDVDMALHPRWQRSYVDWITKFVSSCVKDCKVQILLTTHSPIILSDFPKNNVLYLHYGCDKTHHVERRNIDTFGNSIHTLFVDSFFLAEVGTMGAFAERKINGIINALREKNQIVDENEVIMKTIRLVGDGLIRNRLIELYERKQYDENLQIERMSSNQKKALDVSVSMLREQIKQIEQTIKNLEQLKND